MNALTGTDVGFAHRNSLIDHGRHRSWYAQRWHHAADPQAAENVFHRCQFLGRVELVELRQGASQPDVTGRSVDQVDGDKPGQLPPVLGLDDKVRHRLSGRIDDDAAHLSARTIDATRLGPYRELRLLCHDCLSLRNIAASLWPNRRAGAGTTGAVTTSRPSRRSAVSAIGNPA